MHSNEITYSVVIPVYNEEEILEELYRRLSSVLTELHESYEMIFVNDGSNDHSLEFLSRFHEMNNAVKIVDLSRNFGHQTALSAGLENASGAAVILMDGDLQDPPELFPSLIQKWRGGWDVVYAVRKKRKENILKRTAFSFYYRFLKSISSIPMPLDAGIFSLIDKKVADTLKLMPERNKYISGLRAWSGFKQTGVEFERGERFAGPPRQTFSKLLRLALDGFFSFSYVPLRMVTFAGFVVSFIAFITILVVLYFRFFTDKAILGWASTIVAIMFIGGIQLISLGIIGEYVGRIFDEVKQRPLYVIKQKIGFDPN